MGEWVSKSVDESISQKVFVKSFCRSEFPHKSVNLFYVLVIIKDKLTDLSRRLQQFVSQNVSINWF